MKLQLFNDKEMLTVGSNHTCLAVMTIVSALVKAENQYPEVFLKESKYIEKQVIRHVTQKYLLIILMNMMKSKSSIQDQFLQKTKDLLSQKM